MAPDRRTLGSEKADIFRPNPVCTVLILVALPAPALMAAALGVAATVGFPPWGILIGIFCLGVAAIPAYGVVALMRGWFALHVDAEALSIVGFLRLWRHRIPWSEVTVVGLAQPKKPGGGSMRVGDGVLAIRPVRPWAKTPKWALEWDESRQLLLIGGLANWTSPAEEIVASLRRNAGSKWIDPLSRAPDPCPEDCWHDLTQHNSLEGCQRCECAYGQRSEW